MIIVKLGGSVITDKTRYRSFRKKNCYNILKVVKDLDSSFILIHGGGSFGHIKANEFGLPGQMNDKNKFAFSEVHADMLDLNRKVISILYDLSIPSISIPPAVIYLDGKITLDPIVRYSGIGIVPVTFGDTFIDREWIGIISGDDLAIRLARRLSPKMVIFFTDVDGVYDKNPKIHKDAQLLKRMDRSAIFESMGTDVTGGMNGKVNAALEIARLGTKVYMINGNSPERARMLDSENFIGTVIG
jgi:isopentenyl phosphate kinase